MCELISITSKFHLLTPLIFQCLEYHTDPSCPYIILHTLDMLDGPIKSFFIECLL